MGCFQIPRVFKPGEVHRSSSTMRPSNCLGRLTALSLLHDFMTYIFISYIIVDVYLVSSTYIRDLRAMINGCWASTGVITPCN